MVDSFLGSGTVAVAAKRLKRRFIGSDHDADAIALTKNRLAQKPEPPRYNLQEKGLHTADAPNLVMDNDSDGRIDGAISAASRLANV